MRHDLASCVLVHSLQYRLASKTRKLLLWHFVFHFQRELRIDAIGFAPVSPRALVARQSFELILLRRLRSCALGMTANDQPQPIKFVVPGSLVRRNVIDAA